MTLSLPHGAVQYARTKTFDETSIPTPLLENHSTKPASWGVIAIEAGQLVYTRINQQPQMLRVGTNGVILPGELHKIAPSGPVRFHVAFYHDPAADPAHHDTEEVAL